MTNSCKTNILPDLPADEDSFGSHYRVAQALADLVINDSGGKSIALVGDWGSGKSTVVKFLQGILSQRSRTTRNNIRVFVFDAWTHQGDPLRRTFLEKLIEFLAAEKWTSIKDWEEDLDRLSKRKEKSTTNVENVLSPLGVLFAVFALLLPIGYALFDEFESKLVVFSRPLWEVGLIISLLPLVIGILVRLVKGKSVFPMLFQKSVEVVRKTTLRSPDPTSIEFADIFDRLIAKILKDQQKELLIVVDNLDRVGPEEALSIWTTMRIFFSLNSEKDKDWIPRFWLLVPFDPSALKRLWPKIRDNGVTSKKDELVSAFVDKTFQSTFRVAPPILSDWKPYFLERLIEAFPEHETRSDFDTVYRLYRQWNLINAVSPTPRDIKIFVNKLGSIHRQWCPDIDLRNQALYVIVSGKIKRPDKDLILKDLLEPQIAGLVAGTEWRRDLAAIHFNTEPNKAIQILIADQIESALIKGDHNAIQDMLIIEGFPTVCDHVLEENYMSWANSQPEALAMAAIALEKTRENE